MMTTTTIDRVTFGQRVRERRLTLEWTLERLATESHVSRRTIIYIEQGTASGTTLDTLQLLCSALGVTPNDLLGYVDTGECKSLHASLA